MDTSLAGDESSWAPGQVLRVGTDIEADFANALLSDDPPHDPRAHTIHAAQAELLLEQQQATEQEALTHGNEIPPGEDRVGDAGEVPEGDGPEEAVIEQRGEGEARQEPEQERAVSPQAETRETATAKRTNRKVKPPEGEEAEEVDSALDRSSGARRASSAGTCR